MSGYLDNFGVSEARHERKVKRVLLVALALALGGFGAYVFLHDFQERRQVSRFIDYVREGRYEDAYRLWGCDPAKPCRDYNMQRFLEDWGPAGVHKDFSNVRVKPFALLRQRPDHDSRVRAGQRSAALHRPAEPQHQLQPV